MVTLNVNDDIAGLQMFNGADLVTNGFTLTVNGDTFLDEGAGALVLRIDDIGGGNLAFSTDTLTAQNGAQVLLDGATMLVEEGLFWIDANSSFDGSGTAVLAPIAGKVFNLDGSLSVAGTLVLETSLPGSTIDLDGTLGNGVVNVDFFSSELVVDGPLSDAFSGTINIGADDTLDMRQAWTADSGSVINLDGGLIEGATMTVAGDLNIKGNFQLAQKVSTITANLVSTGDVDVEFGSGFSRWELAGTSMFNGGTINVAEGGTLQIDGTTTFAAAATLSFDSISQFGNRFAVNADTTINQATFDWDAASTTEVNGATLTINSNVIDDDPDQAYGAGGITVTNGTLAVNTSGAWTLSDQLNLTAATVSGSRLVVKRVGGLNGQVIVAPGVSTISADLDVDDQALLLVVNDGNTLNATGATRLLANSTTTVNGTLNLDGPTTFAGGAINGTGTINQNGDLIVTADTTVAVAGLYDWDGTLGTSDTTVQSGVTLTLDVGATEVAPSEAHDGTIRLNSGTLDVTSTAGLWEVGPVGTLAFTDLGPNPTVNGDALRVRSGGQITVAGGVADINVPLELQGTSEIRLLDANALLVLDGPTDLAGGDIVEDVAGGLVRLFGDLTVTGFSTISVTTFDWDGAPTTVEAGRSLTINTTQIDFSNNQYDQVIHLDSGELEVNTATAWIMDGGLNLDNTDGTVPLLHGQDLQIGNGVATGGIDAEVDVAGTGASRIDTNTTFRSDAEVTIAAGATLDLDGTAIFEGGSYTGAGTMDFASLNTVNAATTIDVANLNLDEGNWVLNDDLTLNTAAIDAADGFDSTITIPVSTATLRVNLSGPVTRWELDPSGVIDYTGSAGVPTFLRGSDVLVSGQIDVTSSGVIDARLDVAGTVNIDSAGGTLRLAGGDLSNTNTLDGGIVNGPGRLHLPDGAALVGHGTVHANLLLEDSANLLADGGTLLVTATLLGLGDRIGTASTTGTLDVTKPWNTNLATQLRLDGGVVTGGPSPMTAPRSASARSRPRPSTTATRSAPWEAR